VSVISILAIPLQAIEALNKRLKIVLMKSLDYHLSYQSLQNCSSFTVTRSLQWVCKTWQTIEILPLTSVCGNAKKMRLPLNHS